MMTSAMHPPSAGCRLTVSALVSARGISKSFGTGEARTQALRDVGLELSSNEMALLMGPSGSGKSTLLAILSGLLRPDVGLVEALGEDVWKLSESRRQRFRLRHCGFIFQGYNLFPALTALQQLEMVLCWGNGWSPRAARRRARSTLEELGLGNKLGLRPAELSGGEKQRLAVARALVKEPALIFADEPTAALDWSHGEQVIRLLRTAAQKEGSTVLVVTHDPRLEPLADRVWHLCDGALTAP